jgi:hypothetical protein
MSEIEMLTGMQKEASEQAIEMAIENGDRSCA